MICPSCLGRGGVLRRSYPGNEQFCYPCETCHGYGITHCCDGEDVDQASAFRTACLCFQRCELHGLLPPDRYCRQHARRCVECGINLADLPSLLCPGCEAYREHTR